MITNKERTLFWLNRRLAALESATQRSHEEMANAGMSYEARQRALKISEETAEKTRVEREVFVELIAFVRDKA